MQSADSEASEQDRKQTGFTDVDASSASKPARVMFSSPDRAGRSSDASTRAQDDARRVSRRSSLTDDRVDEVINNLTNMHSMVKLLREGSIDKPDSSRTWDDLANDLEDERTARIIAEEAASTNQQAAEAAAAEAAALRKQLALLNQQRSSQSHSAQTHIGSDHHSNPTQQQGSDSSMTSAQQQVVDTDSDTLSLHSQITSLLFQLTEEQSRGQLLSQEAARSADESAISHASYESARLQLAELTQQLEQERRENGANNDRDNRLSHVEATTAATESAALQEQLSSLQHQLSEKQRELEHAANTIQLQAASAAEVVALQEQVASLQQQLITEHADAQQKLSVASAQTTALNEQVETLQQQLITEHRQAQQQSATASAQITALHEQMETLQQRLITEHGQTQQQSASASAQITALHEQVETLQQRLISEHGQTQQSSATASAQITALHEQVETLQQQLITGHGQTQQHSATAKAELTALHEQVGTLQQQLITQHGQAQQQSAAASAETTALQEQVATLQQQLITEHRQTEQLSESLKQSEQTAMPAQQITRDGASQQVLEAQLAEMSQQLQTHRETAQQLTQQLEAQERAAQQLAQQQAAAQRLTQQQAESAEEDSKKLREQVDTLTQQLAAQSQARDSQVNASSSALPESQDNGNEALERQKSGAAASSRSIAGHSPEQGAEAAPSQQPQADVSRLTVLQLPDQASSEGQARLQSPDQAGAGLSAFQARLHSMLPQLPTIEKLSQLSLEDWWDAVSCELTALLHTRQWAHAQVGRLEGLESEVDQLQNVLQSVANELESGHQHAQAMQRKVHSAEHSLKKAELRVRSAELRAQSAESELIQLRRLHAHAKRQGSPWKSPGARSNSPRVSQLPGHESRLLEPEEQLWESFSNSCHSSSAHPAGGDSSVEVQAAPKEADQVENVPPMTDRSDDSSQPGRAKKSMAGGPGRGGMGMQGVDRFQREDSSRVRARSARWKEADKVSSSNTNRLHQAKSPPGSRFSSPARSLPPHLRSYRNFTQTALLAMHSSDSQAEDALADSFGRIPAVGALPVRRSSSMIRGSKAKGDKLAKGRAVSAQPALRQSCIPNAALSSGVSTPRMTYGMNSAFAAAKQQYRDRGAGHNDDELTEHDRTQNWLKSLTANSAKQATDPKRVDRMVGSFQQLMQQNGLDVPLKRLGPCQYKLGSYKMSLKIGSNKLLVRCGGGYEDLLSAVEKMPQVDV